MEQNIDVVTLLFVLIIIAPIIANFVNNLMDKSDE